MFAISSTTYILLILLTICLCVWRICWTRSRYARLINTIPGSKGLPIIGNLLELPCDHASMYYLIITGYTDKLILTFHVISYSFLSCVSFSIYFQNVTLIEFLQLVHRDWPSKYGGIYRGWAGTRSIICITSPDFMEVLSLLSHFKR